MRFEKKVEEARNSGSEICRRKVNVSFVLLENDFRTKPEMPTQPRSRCHNLVQASSRSVDCGCLCCYDECKCHHFKSCTALIQNHGQWHTSVNLHLKYHTNMNAGLRRKHFEIIASAPWTETNPVFTPWNIVDTFRYIEIESDTGSDGWYPMYWQYQSMFEWMWLKMTSTTERGINSVLASAPWTENRSPLMNPHCVRRFPIK